ncbi:hypothetical protein NEOLI_001315 [Neolecta irregularis DAH-3]|uniref:RRM domain-containing protein n=1 Tax=Neolecta irregularis (strain DAH-3) TaxID=1198029 RepID=A0A1U7LQ56_NEOID|nr:hypothetical protein NEOLI_001315 [Neolecta irregularis DAH-3]|eukprot:OLL24651.1 hypothetical protein NEOLI_001315 [Neolecta irregularis DAH-3]
MSRYGEVQKCHVSSAGNNVSSEVIFADHASATTAVKDLDGVLADGIHFLGLADADVTGQTLRVKIANCPPKPIEAPKPVQSKELPSQAPKSYQNGLYGVEYAPTPSLWSYY